MPDRERVINGLANCPRLPFDLCFGECQSCDCPYYGEAGIKKLHHDAVAMLEEQPQIVRCKDCIHRGKAEKCVLAAISKEKDYPLFILDNRGDWFCADGERNDK